jgi:colanic acid biosynthesis glycosyl transferase WcaI
LTPAASRKINSLHLPFQRWLILTQYYHPEPGAPQIRLRALARELTRMGCQVEVMTAMPNYPEGRIDDEYRGKLFCKDNVDGIPVHRQWLYAAAGRRPLRRLGCYLSFSAGAAARLPFLGNPDVVFVEAQPVTLAFAGYLNLLLRGIPYIYNTPDLQVEIAGDRKWISLDPLIRAAGRMEEFLMKHAFCVSTVTNAFVDHFVETRAIPRHRITMLPNGADTVALRPLPPDQDYARQLGVEGKTVFTYAGTHAPYHGLEILLDVAAQLRDRPDIVLLMVGRGPLRAQIQQQAVARGLTNLIFRDSPFEDMARLMSISRASIATLSPMQAAAKMRLSKVMPALACGVPVLYVGHGESAQMLDACRCGRTISPGDAAACVRAIREMAESPRDCREMGRRGRALAESEFSWTSIVERWVRQLQLIKAGQDPWEEKLPPASFPISNEAVAS